jgi:hypothetical protein
MFCAALVNVAGVQGRIVLGDGEQVVIVQNGTGSAFNQSQTV